MEGRTNRTGLQREQERDTWVRQGSDGQGEDQGSQQLSSNSIRNTEARGAWIQSEESKKTGKETERSGRTLGTWRMTGGKGAYVRPGARRAGLRGIYAKQKNAPIQEKRKNVTPRGGIAQRQEQSMKLQRPERERNGKETTRRIGDQPPRPVSTDRQRPVRRGFRSHRRNRFRAAVRLEYRYNTVLPTPIR